MRVNLRNVPESLINEIDRQVSSMNAKQEKKISRSGYIVLLLSEALIENQTPAAEQIISQLDNLSHLLKEHLSAEKDLIFEINNAAQETKKGNE